MSGREGDQNYTEQLFTSPLGCSGSGSDRAGRAEDSHLSEAQTLRVPGFLDGSSIFLSGL